MTLVGTTGTPVPLSIVVLASRDRARTIVKDAFPRRRTRLTLARNVREFERSFRTGLVDAAVVDLGGPTEDVMRAIDLAREFPSAPFFALSPLRAIDASLAARATSYDFADILVEGVDDDVLREIVTPRAFTTAVFFAFAFPIGHRSGAIPALMRQTGLSVSGLGWAITLHTAAYITAMALTGRVVRHVPVRRLIFLALLVTYKHRANIRRTLAGTEPKIGQKKPT